MNKHSFTRLLWCCFFVFGSVFISLAQENTFDAQRHIMVASQIQARGIYNSKILKAFKEVPRHHFVLPRYLQYAYSDTPLPITEGQTISQPYIVAFMTHSLKLKPTDRVLEIGTGSGYQAAILAQLCDSVFSIDIFESLVNNSRKIFKDLSYNNIYCKTGDGYQGWIEKAPFDAIIVTCSPTHIPKALKDQLAEGGRMIIPVGEKDAQYLVLLEKNKGKIREKSVLHVRFVPMINNEGKKY